MPPPPEPSRILNILLRGRFQLLPFDCQDQQLAMLMDLMTECWGTAENPELDDPYPEPAQNNNDEDLHLLEEQARQVELLASQFTSCFEFEFGA